MRYKLLDLIDMEHFQKLQDRLYEIYSFTSAILDSDGNILAASGCHDICAQFNRKHLNCENQCRQWGPQLPSYIHEVNPAVRSRCPHGLVDISTPIVIDGVHYGDFFTGQLFLEKPDIEFFKAQAKKYAFDEGAYLKAVEKVPVCTRKQLENHLLFVKGLIAFISEIGMKKLKESEAKKQSEIWLKESQTIASLGSYVLNTSTGMWQSSDELDNIFGIDKSFERSITGWMALIHPDDRDMMADHYNNHVLGKCQAFNKEYRVIRHDNRTERWVHGLGKLKFNAQGNPTHMHGTIQDITDRKRADEALRASELNYRTLADSGQALIWTSRTDKLCTYFNKVWLDFTGRTFEQEYGNGWVEGVHPDDVQRCVDIYVAAFEKREAFSMDYRLRRHDGEYRWIQDDGCPRYDLDGKFVGYIGYCLDITERKRMQVEKEKLETQNRQLQKSESLGRMAGAIAHHFNNQLMVVMMNLEIAMSSQSSGEVPTENLKGAMQSARKAAEVSSLMLTYLGQKVTEYELLDLSDTCRQSLPMLQAAMPPTVVLEYDLPSPGPTISSNTNQVQQVLTNLLTNAWEASEGAQDTVRLTVKAVAASDIPAAHRFPIDFQLQEGAYACLEVADAGCGIPTQDVEKLFEPFFTSKFTGRGLGLPVVLGIVRAHQGVITVESEPRQGSIFRVFLPISKETLP